MFNSSSTLYRPARPPSPSYMADPMVSQILGCFPSFACGPSHEHHLFPVCSPPGSLPGFCEWKMLPAISVNKGCISHQAATVCVCMCSVMSNSLRPGGLWASRLLYPGKNTGVGCHFLLQGIFLTRDWIGSLLYLLHWQMSSLSLYHLGSHIKPPQLFPMVSLRERRMRTSRMPPIKGWCLAATPKGTPWGEAWWEIIGCWP